MVFRMRVSGMNVNYTSFVGMIAIGIGGISSALWGTIIAVKYKKYDLTKIFRDFFDIKQKYSSYLVAVLFLCMDFFYIVFNGKILIDFWYTPMVLFLKAIIFGGIEEIGWRYVFQPVLQEQLGYVVSTVITFCLWGIWHFSYFYIEGTLSQVQVLYFLIGLLTNCFILSALYIKTNSLWICVMTHSLINVLSQLSIGGNYYVAYVCKIIIIVIAIILSVGKKNNDKEKVSVY
jgi:membrane protease YdiL (CAAX protease family)